MADLDSFFAKKDKKKLKGKKFTTTDEIAKRLEETERKVEKTSNVATVLKHEVKKTEDIAETTPATIAASPVDPSTEILPPAADPPAAAEPEPVPENKQVEEEQWNDFKDDETVDVSNLRIIKLSIEGEEEGRGGQGEGGEEGKESTGEDKKDGVWKIEEQKSIQSTICEAVDAGVDDGLGDVKATVAAMSANPRWSSQLAKELQPSLLPRGVGAPGSRRKKAAPDITSAMAFPSLADAQANTGRKKNQDDRDGVGGGGGGDGRSGGGHQGGGGGLRGLLARQEAGGSSGGAYKPPMMRTSNRFGALTDQSSAMRHS